MTRHPHDFKHDPNADLLSRLQRAERDLVELRDQLEHSHRLAMLGTLAAGVIHEINNILTPVQAYAQMVSSNPHDADLLIKFAAKTTSGITQATEIADSMLKLARPGQSIAQPAKARVRDACQEALNCLGRDPDRDGITCTLDMPPDLTCAIRPLALQQVVLNLLLNASEALRAAPSRERRITIRAWKPKSESHHSGTPGETVRIEVADNGPGIPEDIQQKLFTPFVSGIRSAEVGSSPDSAAAGGKQKGDGGSSRMHYPQSRPEGNWFDTGSSDAHHTLPTGSGLGLSVCRTLIEAVGGTISARSDPDSGTVFSIVLQQDQAQSCRIAG